MTEENYNYRTSQTLLRNQFQGRGKFQIPVIPKFQEQLGDLDDLLLIGYDKINLEDHKHVDRMVHFFLYDYRFERVWKNPDSDIEKLSHYKAVLSPDFSMYLEMAPVLQLYNVFRNRWCGAYWASKGIRVIPTVNWGSENTFDFCFDGIEKGSVVAVSTYMASAHDNRQDQKDWFMSGYREMLRRIEPEKIICYNTPFPEMEGDIIYVDYERSSWKYLGYESPFENDDLEAYKIGSARTKNYDTIEPYRIGGTYKGGGSAYGGKWRPNPNKPYDYRYVGQPGEIKTTVMRNGEIFKTKIGNNGKAEIERHFTTHNRADKHTNPHDHRIDWSTPDEHPIQGPPINYPDGAPEFKQYRGERFMSHLIVVPEESLKFETISEFKQSLNWGAEIIFVWNHITYGVIRYGTNNKITIYEADRPETEKMCESPDEVLEYMVGTDCLRDVITKVDVLSRTI